MFDNGRAVMGKTHPKKSDQGSNSCQSLWAQEDYCTENNYVLAALPVWPAVLARRHLLQKILQTQHQTHPAMRRCHRHFETTFHDS